jgi:Mannosyltransferase (PIG-V)
MRQSVREAVLPYLVARVIVLGALGLAHFIVDRTHPATAGVAARVHEGLLGWDAGYYKTIARVGYAPLGKEGLRFFPAVPVLTHVVAWFPGLGDGAALLVVANVAAFVATALFFVLVRRETASTEVARRAVWFLSLAPAAFVLVMGYAESTLLCLAIGCFLALRPGRSAGRSRPNFALAGGLALAAALTRPIGVLLALAVAVELVRWWVRLSRGRRLAGLGATAAPFVGLLGFGLWAQHVVGDLWAPLRVQFESTHHGGISDPFVTLGHDARGLFHGHVGTALHIPWVLLAVLLLVVCWRRLPASYTVFAAAVLLVAVAGSNLDSFERYALSAFPLTMAGALVCGRPLVERTVLVLLPAALAGYALLAFLNISVP